MNLIIAGVGQLTDYMQVPLGVVVNENQTVKLMIDEQEHMQAFDVYVVDLLNGRIYDLSNTVSLTLDKGEYIDRFKLVFRETAALALEDDGFENETLIYQDEATKELVAYSPDTKIHQIEVYSVLGKKILVNTINVASEDYRIITDFVASGVYIVKVFTDRGVLSKKLLIK